MKGTQCGEIIRLEKKEKFRFLKVFKNDKLARASFKSYSLGPYRVSLLLNEKFHKESKFLLDGELNKVKNKNFSISAQEYSKRFGVSLSVSGRILKTSVKILIDSNISLESYNSKSFIYINLCSHAEYIDKKGILATKFTDEILPFIAQNAKRYTLYNLDDITKFKSFYSVRLFELVQGFKYSGWMVKTVDELRVIFNTGPKLQRYNMFKTNTFERAAKEINLYHPHLNLSFEEIRTGRKVESIKFLFAPAVKEVGYGVKDPEEIPDLLPIPNLKPLDKYEVKEKLRLAAERKKKREQKFIEKKVALFGLSKEEEIACKLLKGSTSIDLIAESTGISKKRVLELKELLKPTFSAGKA